MVKFLKKKKKTEIYQLAFIEPNKATFINKNEKHVHVRGHVCKFIWFSIILRKHENRIFINKKTVTYIEQFILLFFLIRIRRSGSLVMNWQPTQILCKMFKTKL